MSLITSLRLSELTLPAGSTDLKLTHGYDKDDLVTSLRRTGASNANSLMLTRSATAGFLMAADIGTPTILREEVTYDGWGAPTEIRGKWGGAGMGQIGLTYDAAGRLESATEIPSAPRVYTYDARGNRNVTAVDEQDRATQVGAPGQPDYTFYTYDAHGNVATRTVGGTTHTYTWDGEGSLLGVAGTTPGTITYDVDAKGRRVGKRVNGTLERQWMYDGHLRIVAEVVHTPVVRYRVYGYVPERHLPVLMLEKVSGAEAQYRIYGDHLGSLRAVVRVSDGKAIQTMRHGPWGEVEDDSVASTFSRVPFGFAGGIYDEKTGLVRFGAREYDARTGRWLSKDEARFGGGENFFEYAGGDPVNRVDLDGRSPAILEYFLRWLIEMDRNRNRFNQCPPRVPTECRSGRDWTRTSPLSHAWRGSYGAECIYNSRGDLELGQESYNYGPNPYSLSHVLLDFLPGFSAEQGGGRAGTPGQTQVCGCN